MRYLPHTPTIRKQMLETIGVASIEDLFADVPKQARHQELLDLPNHQDEWTIEQDFKALADQNLTIGSCPSFLGAGAYHHHIPASVDALIQRGEFLTSYTPYQPEISQGTLQYLFEFQTQICLLTGMEVANASMYDGATAAAEAVMMAHRITKRSHAIVS
ncbi:MAG TPA: glycine dehydrogenase, partial [Candidatus Nitrosotenuis sp.]|nr:glycine dehydrogenase [Candidatus Nitrosotenuis sp.]